MADITGAEIRRAGMRSWEMRALLNRLADEADAREAAPPTVTPTEFVNTVEELDALPVGSVLIGQLRAWMVYNPDDENDAYSMYGYRYYSTDNTGLYLSRSMLLHENFPLRVIRP